MTSLELQHGATCCVWSHLSSDAAPLQNYKTKRSEQTEWPLQSPHRYGHSNCAFFANEFFLIIRWWGFKNLTVQENFFTKSQTWATRIFPGFVLPEWTACFPHSRPMWSSQLVLQVHASTRLPPAWLPRCDPTKDFVVQWRRWWSVSYAERKLLPYCHCIIYLQRWPHDNERRCQNPTTSRWAGPQERTAEERCALPLPARAGCGAWFLVVLGRGL